MTTTQTIDGAPRQMISVPLDTLKCYLSGDGGDWVEAGHELRDLLDAPCPPAKCHCAPLCYLSDSSCPAHGKPAAQPHSEPVYQVCNGIDGWIDVDLLRYTACSLDPEEYEVRTLYAEQPAPVALDVLITGFYTTESGGGKYAINIGFRSMADMQAADAQLRELLKSR